MSLEKIELLSNKLATERDVLASLVDELQEDLEQSKEVALPDIKRAAKRVLKVKEKLGIIIADNPQLFVKPRTLIMSGIKIGFQKGKGLLGYKDASAVIKLIRKHYPEKEDVLVKTTESIIKKAINNMTASELRRIGITVIPGDDQVLIKPAGSDIDKLVSAYLGDENENK